jgi:hypothetical protein
MVVTGMGKTVTLTTGRIKKKKNLPAIKKSRLQVAAYVIFGFFWSNSFSLYSVTSRCHLLLLLDENRYLHQIIYQFNSTTNFYNNFSHTHTHI